MIYDDYEKDSSASVFSQCD